MDGQAWSCVELLVANVALEVLCLLVVDEHLLIIKLTIAVPGENKSRAVPIKAHHLKVPTGYLYSRRTRPLGHN